MKDEITVTVPMKVRYMYSFLFQHIHRSFQGIFGVVLSVAALILFVLSLGTETDDTRKVILLVIGLLFTVVNPVMLYVKAMQQVALSPVYKNPLTYQFSEEGMRVIQGEQSQLLPWDKVVEVRKTKSVLIIYTSRTSASILGYQEFQEKRQEIEDLIASCCKQAGVQKLPKSMQ